MQAINSLQTHRVFRSYLVRNSVPNLWDWLRWYYAQNFWLQFMFCLFASHSSQKRDWKEVDLIAKVAIIQKTVIWFAVEINWLVSIWWQLLTFILKSFFSQVQRFFKRQRICKFLELFLVLHYISLGTFTFKSTLRGAESPRHETVQ